MKRVFNVFKYIKTGRAVAALVLSALFAVGVVSGTWKYATKPSESGYVKVEAGFIWENYYKQIFSGGKTYCYIYGYNCDNYDTLFDGNRGLSNNTSFRWTNYNSSSNDEFKKVTMELHKTDENATFTFDEIRLHHFVDSGGASRLPDGIEISYLDENGDWLVFASCTLEGDGEWRNAWGSAAYYPTDDNPPHYQGATDNKAETEQSWRYPGAYNGNYRMQLRTEKNHGEWDDGFGTVDFTDSYLGSGGAAPFTVFKINSGAITAKSVRITLIPSDSSNRYNCTGLTELEFFVGGTKYPEGSAP